MRALRIVTVVCVLLISGTAPGGSLDQNGVSQQWKGPSESYTIIDFAASWCLPCWVVLPKLEAYASEHPNVRVLVVDVDDDVSGRDRIVRELKLSIPVVWDESREIAEHYHPEGMPAMFILNPEGEVVHHHVGSSAREWEQMVSFLDDATN